MHTVIYPGSFNPITNGHTDLVDRALKLFDHVVLAIGTSMQKDPKVHLKDRIELCQQVLEPYGDKVSVEGFNNLLVEYVRSKDTRFILRGLRTMTDFDYEFQMAEMNQFFKNVTIAGGFLMLTAFGPGNLSVDARGDRGSSVAA